MYENTINSNIKKPPSYTNLFVLKEIPEVESFIKGEIGDISSSKYESGKPIDNLSKASFDINNIVAVTDTIGNKNYSIRFVFYDTPENIFYNLVVNFVASGEKRIFVEKYTCDIDKFELYKNSQYDFKNFQGTVDLYRSNAFFKKSSMTNKITEDPCIPLLYPSGDPIPSRSSFIYSNSNSGTGGGGAGSNDGTYGGWSWSPSFSWSPSSSSDGGSIPQEGNGCCSCGNCGLHFYPPSEAKEHVQTQKMASTPCENIEPIGFVGLWTEPEKVHLVRSNLPISLEQWQWLHGKDYFSDIILNFLTAAGGGYTLNEHKKVALWAIDYRMTHPPRDNFAVWTMEYLQNNPDVTIEQFENWFMETSEGQDGDYDAAYWEDPNLTFPQQNLPSYSAYYNGMARFPNGNLMVGADNVYNFVGGAVQLLRINNREITENTCALKVSIALNRSGVVIPKIPGTFEGGGDFKDKYFFVNAKALNTWMRETFGTNPATSKTPYNASHRSFTAADGGIGGGEFPDKLKGMTGIYSMITTKQYNDQTGLSGHADLLFTDKNDKGNCAFGCFFNKPIERIDVWILN